MLVDGLAEMLAQRTSARAFYGAIGRLRTLARTAGCAGEMLDDLRQLGAERSLLELFNRRVDEFGLAFRRPQSASLTHAVDRFGTLLDQVEAAHPSLQAKVRDLQSRLVKMQQVVSLAEEAAKKSSTSEL